MTLSQLILNLPLDIQAGERWAVVGPEAGIFETRLSPATLVDDPNQPGLDGLLVAGALSTRPDALDWLLALVKALRPETSLVVADWQYEGPLNSGPELEQRVKRGRLCRLLRQAGFRQVEVVTNSSHYYIVQASKRPSLTVEHAGHFVKVADLKDLPRNKMVHVELFGHNIIVANTGKEIVAFARACPHARAPLERGLLRGRNVVCRSHGYIWNVCTGEPVEPDDEDLLLRYPVKVDAALGHVLVSVTP